ncbi:MAG: hypothetical protein RIB93_15440 [Coleofasciculus sp. D1-CHI-01]|uniref:hypothetical protein n=1 Tax=Coleofasciculus sp. D1-CHI-01 TaxID=3068482 RepID=UPI0032FCF848
MLDLLIHVWLKPNKTAIACLGLVPLVISCAAADVPDPPSDTAASSASEETVVAEKPIAPQPDQSSSTDIAQNANVCPQQQLVERHFETQNHNIYICSGTVEHPQGFFVGIGKHNGSRMTRITLPLISREAENYVAFDDFKYYSIDPQHLQVSLDEHFLVNEPVTMIHDAGEDTNNLLIDLEEIEGMQYADARARLLQKGWIPVEAPDPGPYGVERMAYDAGFTEVAACAGTGAGQCSFEFIHPGEQQSLSVITYGGSELEVGDWDIQPSSSVEAATPADSSPVAQVQSVIPMQFQGLWDDLELCDIPTSDGRLRIGLNRIEFYETGGPVLEVVTKGDLEMSVTAEYSSEGETWTETNSFKLSSDRSALTDSKTNVVRYRCPN